MANRTYKREKRLGLLFLIITFLLGSAVWLKLILMNTCAAPAYRARALHLAAPAAPPSARFLHSDRFAALSPGSLSEQLLHTLLYERGTVEPDKFHVAANLTIEANLWDCTYQGPPAPPPPALAPPGDPIDALPLPKCGVNNAIVAVNATLGKILTPVSGLYFMLYASVDFTTWWQVRPTSPQHLHPPSPASLWCPSSHLHARHRPAGQRRGREQPVPAPRGPRRGGRAVDHRHPPGADLRLPRPAGLRLPRRLRARGHAADQALVDVGQAAVQGLHRDQLALRRLVLVGRVRAHHLQPVAAGHVRAAEGHALRHSRDAGRARRQPPLDASPARARRAGRPGAPARPPPPTPTPIPHQPCPRPRPPPNDALHPHTPCKHTPPSHTPSRARPLPRASSGSTTSRRVARG